MKLNNTHKCQIIGAFFLLMVTGIEITMFLYIFTLCAVGGKSIAVSGTVIIFNVAIWWFATRYQTTKEYLEREENEDTKQ